MLTGASLLGAPVGFAGVRRVLAGGGLALVLFGGACRRAASPPVWHEEAGARWRELDVPRSGGPGFFELPPSPTRIRFTNSVSLDSALLKRHLAPGGGGGPGHLDGEGLP